MTELPGWQPPAAGQQVHYVAVRPDGAAGPAPCIEATVRQVHAPDDMVVKLDGVTGSGCTVSALYYPAFGFWGDERFEAHAGGCWHYPADCRYDGTDDVHVDWHMTQAEWDQLRSVLVRHLDVEYIDRLHVAGKLTGLIACAGD